MIIAIMVMFVASLLLVAAFTAANGDVHQSHTDLDPEAGVLRGARGRPGIRVQTQANPNYWQTCPKPESDSARRKQPRATKSTTLAASTDPEARQSLQLREPVRDDHRVQRHARQHLPDQVGRQGRQEHARDRRELPGGGLPQLHLLHAVRDAGPEPATARAKEQVRMRKLPQRARKTRRSTNAETIDFGPEDTENGPLHTDDAAGVCGGANSAAQGHEPPDVVEINGGAVAGGAARAARNTTPPPENPNERPRTRGARKRRAACAPTSNANRRKTNSQAAHELVLEGGANKIKVTYLNEGGNAKETIEWPKNGLIYVQSAEDAAALHEIRTRKHRHADDDHEEEENCGSVYVTARTANR